MSGVLGSNRLKVIWLLDFERHDHMQYRVQGNAGGETHVGLYR